MMNVHQPVAYAGCTTTYEPGGPKGPAYEATSDESGLGAHSSGFSPARVCRREIPDGMMNVHQPVAYAGCTTTYEPGGPKGPAYETTPDKSGLGRTQAPF